MLLDQRTRRSVAFLMLKDSAGELIPVGSAFVIGAWAGVDRRALYVVTTQHLVQQAGRNTLHLRLRREDNEPVDVPYEPEHWILHDSADVAIARFAGDTSLVESISLEQEMADREWLLEKDVDAGAEVFSVGLFVAGVPGESREQWVAPVPVARFGNIAMMPGDKIPVEILPNTLTYVEAFLVEARSFGGVSGSPVYVYLQGGHNRAYGPFLPGFGRLLGLVSGHWDIPSKVAMPSDWPTNISDAISMLNAGMAIVTPAQAIVDILRGDELLRERQETSQQSAMQ